MVRKPINLETYTHRETDGQTERQTDMIKPVFT